MRRWVYVAGGVVVAAAGIWLYLVLRDSIFGESGAWGGLVWSLVIGDALSFPIAASLFYLAFRPRKGPSPPGV